MKIGEVLEYVLLFWLFGILFIPLLRDYIWFNVHCYYSLTFQLLVPIGVKGSEKLVY